MAAEYSTKYVFIMATVVLQVPDESLVSKVKNACKMLVGVTTVRVQKSTPKVDDITKTAHYKEAMDDVKNGRVYHANSVDDMFPRSAKQQNNLTASLPWNGRWGFFLCLTYLDKRRFS